MKPQFRYFNLIDTEQQQIDREVAYTYSAYALLRSLRRIATSERAINKSLLRLLDADMCKERSASALASSIKRRNTEAGRYGMC